MFGAPEPRHPTRTDAERTRSFLLRAGILAVLLVILGYVAYRVHQHFEQLEFQIATLQREVQQSSEQARQAAATSTVAVERATQAEQNAQQAALGRLEAEQASAEAAREAEQARLDAEHAAQQAEVAREELAQIRHQREAEIERLEKALSHLAPTQRTALGLIMTLGSDSIKFDFDKADLHPPDGELLSRIAGVLLTSYGFRIQVFGHTDDVGTAQYNQGLSERRARAVRDYLVQAGVNPELVSMRGFGKTSPRVKGTDEQARARNRRVEIAIVDAVIDFKGEVKRN
jgi:outer membrane protein OmpA-like peptidoglycan-associated protein